MNLINRLSSCQIASMIRIYAAQYSPSGRLYLIHPAIFQSKTIYRRESIILDNPNAIHHWYILRDLLLNNRYITHPIVSKRNPPMTSYFANLFFDMFSSFVIYPMKGTFRSEKQYNKVQNG